jgi:hypothetical protein
LDAHNMLLRNLTAAHPSNGKDSIKYTLKKKKFVQPFFHFLI